MMGRHRPHLSRTPGSSRPSQNSRLPSHSSSQPHVATSIAVGVGMVGANKSSRTMLREEHPSSAVASAGSVDKIFEKVINPYLTEVLKHPQSIEMREGMFHIRDVEGPKKTGSREMRLEAMEQQVFKCQGMVEHGFNANHMMITEFTNKHNMDAIDIGKQLSRLYDTVD
ncbi:40S ribosomal protein S5-1 [Hordeum vulgare]|nr:40S ribosomal protein S5-1 [Hordeum vulgare]